MSTVNTSRVIALSGLFLGGVSAFAGDIDSNYSFVWAHYVSFETSFAGTRTNELTAELLGSRLGGTDTLCPTNYLTFCVELGEYINPSNNPIHHNSVTPLLGSTTTTGGFSGPITFTPSKNADLECLYGGFFTTFAHSPNMAAFQLAVWELTFDSDKTLLSSAGTLWGTDQDLSTSGIQLDSISQDAENMLTAVRNGTITSKTKLLLLSTPGVQDLITPVPEPGSIIALASGVAALALKRRKK